MSLGRSFPLETRLLFALLPLALAIPGLAQESTARRPPATVVLADPKDPYHILAREIAADGRRSAGDSSLPLKGSLAEALAQNPTFLIWVVSPSHLSDRVMVDLGVALGDRRSAVSLGIISGRTLEEARALWLRAGDVAAGRAAVVRAARRTVSPAGGIRIVDGEQDRILPLTADHLRRALEGTSYLTFNGHGGRGYLRLDRETIFEPPDIPPLPPMVIGTGSCNTFRIWEEDSIALAFASRGAAAYAGFVWSPNSGYLIGGFDGLPLRYAWPDCPIGHVIQIQNRGALRGFARIPYYVLLGDPRIAFQAEAPYRVLEDRTEGDSRILRFADAPRGFIPVRIAGGAGWSFVAIEGVGAAAERDPFYNSRLEMVNIAGDKFILFAPRGREFTVRLRRRAPVGWAAANPVTGALDDLLIVRPRSSLVLLAILDVAAIGAVIGTLRRKRLAVSWLPPGLMVGLAFAVLHASYMLARVDRVTITSKPVSASPLAILSTFIVIGCGAILLFAACSRRGQLAGLVVALSPPLAVSLLTLGGIAALNLLVTRPALGSSLWNYAPAYQAVIGLIIQAVLVALGFALARRWRHRLILPSEPSCRRGRARRQ